MYLQATNMHILGTESMHGHVILFMAIVLIGIVSFRPENWKRVCCSELHFVSVKWCHNYIFKFWDSGFAMMYCIWYSKVVLVTFCFYYRNLLTNGHQTGEPNFFCTSIIITLGFCHPIRIDRIFLPSGHNFNAYVLCLVQVHQKPMHTSEHGMCFLSWFHVIGNGMVWRPP